MTHGHLQADCLYTGISSGPNAQYRVRESLYLFYIPSVADDNGSAVTDAAVQLAGTQCLPLFLETVPLLLTSQSRRLPGRVDVTRFGGFDTFTIVGTADG